MDKETGLVFQLITNEEFDPFEARLVFCLNYCIERMEHDETGFFEGAACDLDQLLVNYKYKEFPPQKR